MDSTAAGSLNRLIRLLGHGASGISDGKEHLGKQWQLVVVWYGVTLLRLGLQQAAVCSDIDRMHRPFNHPRYCQVDLHRSVGGRFINLQQRADGVSTAPTCTSSEGCW